MAKKKTKGYVMIDPELCKGCYLCVSVCPRKTLGISRMINQKGYYPAEFQGGEEGEKQCTGCANCAIICPDIAIEVYRE